MSEAGLEVGDWSVGTAPALASSPVTDVAGRVALALRFAPKDAATVERLVGIVERSALSTERQQAIVERLRGDHGLGEQVSRAVREALGRDDAAERAALIGALERVTDPGLDVADPARTVAEAVATATGLGPDAVEGLCRALSDWFGGWWEEEEEEAPPGDYAAEESGI